MLLEDQMMLLKAQMKHTKDMMHQKKQMLLLNKQRLLHNEQQQQQSKDSSPLGPHTRSISNPSGEHKSGRSPSPHVDTKYCIHVLTGRKGATTKSDRANETTHPR